MEIKANVKVSLEDLLQGDDRVRALLIEGVMDDLDYYRVARESVGYVNLNSFNISEDQDVGDWQDNLITLLVEAEVVFT